MSQVVCGRINLLYVRPWVSFEGVYLSKCGIGEVQRKVIYL